MINISSTENAADWHVCTGQVGELVHRLRWRKRSTRLRRGGLLATLAMITVFGNYFYSDVATELSVKASGSPCDHYAQELRDFYSNRSLYELEPAFWEHLSKCPDCQRDFRFFGGISHTHFSHAWPSSKPAKTPAPNRHISLDELLKQATLAAR
jgi:hypothetical protein